MSARDAVLARIASALGPQAEPRSIPREYRQAGEAATDAVALFCDRAADYLATVRRVTEAELDDALAAACTERGTTTVATSPGEASRRPTMETVTDSPDIPAAALDRFDAALTGCALAIAETGSIVLDGGPASGRRALTLVPDHHLCIVRADQIVAAVPDAIGALKEAADEGRPITFVSGPSATSDIELERVEGVHGPRKLDIFVVSGGAPPG
jgi:L-lactate dehydrogenase complex protein LldG